MKYVAGDILTPNGFQKGYIGITQDGTIRQGKGSAPEKPLVKGIIIPTFINAHTHIGDSFIRTKKIKLPRNVEKLVAPPNGLKHTLLKTASEKEIIKGMKQSIQDMMDLGISSFCDFRENGIKGVHQLKTALKNKKINSIILSRPLHMNYDKKEVDLLLENSEGIGLSSISDWDYSEIEKIAEHTKQKKKRFVLHASEAIREDIDAILDLKPDFLIHMIKATESDLIRVKEENIPIVLCPRSNEFFHLKTNIKLMKKSRVDLMLGTDNAMINTPNVLEEAHFLMNTSRVFSVEELLNMITYTPRKALNLDDCIQGFNRSCNIVVLEKKSLKTVYIPK
ncbi:MAG: amidohydrolase family protein [Thermoplasmatales archaeon]|nr:amidohydrolase family protein [Thermoplasmatales archaeon]